MSSFDLAKRMAAEYQKIDDPIGMFYEFDKAVENYRSDAKKYLEIIDGFGLELLDFKVLSPESYKYCLVFLVKSKPVLKYNYIATYIKSPHYIKTMQSEFDRGSEDNPIMELSIRQIADYYLISFYAEV